MVTPINRAEATAPKVDSDPPAVSRPGQVTYLVFAKAPVPGTVKTRLTPSYSYDEAAALAAAALLDTLDAVLAAARPGGQDRHGQRLPPVVALSGDPARARGSEAVRRALDDFTVIEQCGEGLGPRLAHAHCAAAGELGATVQIGMDTPQVQAAMLEAAEERVATVGGPDAVLGPATDGGWWLLALRHAALARLIADVPTSTPQTGRLTLAALQRGGLTVELLPTLTDVDEPGDVPVVADAAPGTRFAALAAALGPRTAAT